MLHLEAGVHLQEVEASPLVHQEFDRAGVGVAHGGGDRGGRLRQPLPEARRHGQRRRLLDHFLMAALNGALALDERQHRAVMVGEHLHLDVPWPDQPPLEVDGRIAERGARFGSRGAHGAQELPGSGDRAHALAATAGDGLHHEGIADALRRGRELGVAGLGRQRRLRAGHDGNAGGAGRVTRGGLAAHQRYRARGGADEREAGVFAGGGERTVLRQEAVAGMHGVGAGRPGGGDQPRRRGDNCLGAGWVRWPPPRRPSGRAGPRDRCRRRLPPTRGRGRGRRG